jgi:hypothetical protein
MSLFYVATTGSNANPGTEGSPFLTLDYALSLPALAPGDTIHIAAGTYADYADTAINGTSSNRINIVGAGVGNTIITGLLTIENDYYTVSGITFSLFYLKISGVADTDNGSYNSVENCAFTANTQGVYVFSNTPNGLFGPSNNTIRNCSFFSSVGNGMASIGGHHNAVENCTFTNNRGYDAIRTGGIGNVFRGNTFTGINNPIVVSVASAISSGGVVTVVTATPHDLDNNAGVIIAGANEAAFNTGGSGRVATVINATTLTYAPLVDPGDGVTATGTVTAQGANHADIIQAFAGGGYITKDIIFERNRIIDSAGQFGNIEGEVTNTEVTAFTIRNNIHVNSTLQFNIFVPDCKIYNNTIYNPQGALGFRAIGYVPTRGIANNMEVYNNLLIRVGTSSSGGAYSFETTTGCVGDYNIITGKSDGAQTGYSETHGINGEVTPTQLFIDAESDDFRLQSDSPAIGIGLDLSAQFTDDIDGNTRVVPWDSGAYKTSGPDAPSSLSASAISTSVIALGWTNNALDADGIYVERSSDNSNFTQIASLASTADTYSATGLASGTQYWFRVRAYNENGNSAYSNTDDATTEAAPVVGPGNILTGFIGFW